MKLLLSSANRSVLKRWAGLLEGGEHQLERAGSISDLKGLSSQNKYDLILVHRSLIDRELFSQLLDSSPQGKFFLLSDRPEEEEGLVFLKQGIVGYGNTYISRARLAEAVRSISNGSVWVGQKLMQRLIAEVHAGVKEQEAPDVKQRLSGLTRREQEISRLVAKGRSNLEIAFELDITERTVKAHLTSIYEKTNTGNRLSLALLVNKGTAPKSS